MLIGLGLDDPEGHLRFTRGDDFKLLGGSETVHSEMLRRARVIKDELFRRGLSLNDITQDQIEEIRFIVEEICAG